MSNPKRKRRRFQFSLRTLLVFVLLVRIGLSWLAVRMDRAEKQRQAVQAITGHVNGYVGCAYQWD